MEPPATHPSDAAPESPAAAALRGYGKGFATLPHETVIDVLPVRGSLPVWLNGTLIRNGPAQFEVGSEAYRHWFDGLAMLHAFQIKAGMVSYRNRFLESQARLEALENGQISRAEFATDPCRSVFGRLFSVFSTKLTDNASISVTRLGQHYVAMTETPLPVAFDPKTLDTLGVVSYEDDLDAPMESAHPLIDPQSGRLYSFLVDFGRTSSYQVYRVDAGSRRRKLLCEIPVEKPAYMHSFGMTERYIVLAEFPLIVNPLRLLLSGRPFIENYAWTPEHALRFHIIRKSDGALMSSCTTQKARFGFHVVNAFEQAEYVVLDAVTYPDASIIDDLYLDRLRGDGDSPGTGTLWRYRLPLRGGSARGEQLADTPLELPRIHDERVSMKPYRYVYGIGTRTPGNFADQLVKVDVEHDTAQTWHEDGCYPGEPVFVPTPGTTGEDAGVVLSVVLDAANDASFLVVLDAETFTERARATVPHVIPFGFHGAFLGG